MLILFVLATSQVIPPVASTESISAMDQLVKVSVVLLIIVLSLFAIAWLIRRYQGFSKYLGMTIKTVAVSPVGPKEKIVLIDVGGRQFLIGITSRTINTLAEFDEPVVVAKEPKEADFSKKLKEIMTHGKVE